MNIWYWTPNKSSISGPSQYPVKCLSIRSHKPSLKRKYCYCENIFTTGFTGSCENVILIRGPGIYLLHGVNKRVFPHKCAGDTYLCIYLSPHEHIKPWKHFPHYWFFLRESVGHISIVHYNDVIMTTIASQITSLTIVYSTVYSDVDQSKHQSSASLAFVRGIHRGPVNSPHKWPVTRKMFPFDDVIMIFSL